MELPYLNRVTIAGRLVRDPELRHTNAGVPVANFKIACKKQYDDTDGSPREEICYVGVAVWQDLARICKSSLMKGSAVLVEGELKSRVRQNDGGVKRSFVEIRALKVRRYIESDQVESLDDGQDSIASLPTEQPEFSTATQFDTESADSGTQPEEAVTQVASDHLDEYNMESEEL